jgi:Putative auto-transporter adhesin, head GIN domain
LYSAVFSLLGASCLSFRSEILNPNGFPIPSNYQTIMKNLSFAALSAVCLALAACDIEIGGIRGNGHVVTEQRPVGPFSNIDAGGAFHIEWSGGPPSAAVTADENLQQYIEVTTENNVLRLRTRRSIHFSHSLKVTITSASLEAAELNGACQLVAHQIKGSRFYLETNGAAKVTVDGAVDELIANMTGASHLSADSLQTKNAQISVTGAGKALIAVSDSLKVSITGAGKVEYIGNPTHVEREIAGAGAIRRRGGGPSAGPIVIGRSHD